MSGKDDDMIRRMARNAQQPVQGLTVAAPLNDVQLVALMAAVIGGTSKQDMGQDQAVQVAINLVAYSITAMRGGDLQRAQQALQQPEAESVGN